MKKIIGTDDESRLQRNINNNARILKEFPWLWGVQSSWHLNLIVMRVSNEDLSPFFSDLITHGVGMGNDRLHGIWIHMSSLVCGGLGESVRTVWDGRNGVASICDGQKQMMWCTKLHSFIAAEHTRPEVLHIAMRYWNGDAMVIYRPKPRPSFNQSICECMW